MAEKKTVQEAVKEILKLRGKEIFKNIKHFLALIDDLAPECVKERKILKKSLDEELLAVFIDDSKKVNHRIKILQDNLDYLGESWADFIIESFGLPLGWNQEIREMKLNRQVNPVSSQATSNGQATYEDIVLNEDTLKILGLINKQSHTTLNIPATFNTCFGTIYRITKIGENIFKDCDKLETIVIPNTVTEIGNSAFEGCKSLKNINIPNEVTKIGDSAFCGCSVLEKIIIPNKVTEIGYKAFSGCELLENVILPDSLVKIGKLAFENCKSFTNIIIPNSATDVSKIAFLGCDKIEQFTLPAYLSGFVAKEVTLDENILKQLGYEVKYENKGTNDQKLVSFKKNGQDVTSFDIPATYIYGDSYNKVTNIAYNVFWECSSLKSVTIPNTITQIPGTLFWGCPYLTTVTIPDSVTKIGDSVFYNCKSLTTLTIPDSVTQIGKTAFHNCYSLTISVPQNCSIGSDAFTNCKQVIERT